MLFKYAENCSQFAFEPTIFALKFAAIMMLDYTRLYNERFNEPQLYIAVVFLFLYLLLTSTQLFSVLDPTCDTFVRDLSRKLCEINMFVRGKYGPLCCLVNVLGAQAMLKIHPSIPEDLMSLMTDQTVVPHVRISAYGPDYTDSTPYKILSKYVTAVKLTYIGNHFLIPCKND